MKTDNPSAELVREIPLDKEIEIKYPTSTCLASTRLGTAKGILTCVTPLNKYNPWYAFYISQGGFETDLNEMAQTHSLTQEGAAMEMLIQPTRQAKNRFNVRGYDSYRLTKDNRIALILGARQVLGITDRLPREIQDALISGRLWAGKTVRSL